MNDPIKVTWKVNTINFFKPRLIYNHHPSNGGQYPNILLRTIQFPTNEKPFNGYMRCIITLQRMYQS